MRKILLLKLTRMGDILEAQPLLRDIRAAEPGAHITMVVNETFRGAAALLPELDAILAFPFFGFLSDLQEAHEDFLSLYRRLEAFAETLSQERYDLVLNLTNSRMSGMLMGFLRTRQKRGLWFDERGQREVQGPLIRYFGANEGMRSFSPFNLSDFMRALYGRLGSTPESALTLEPAAQAQAERWLNGGSEGGSQGRSQGRSEGGSGPLVGLQLGASEACKRWRIQDFTALASQLLVRRDLRWVLVGSRDEAPLAEVLVQRVRAALAEAGAEGQADRLINLVGKTSLPELAAVVARMQLLVSNDTGTMHMAASLGVRVVNLSLGSAFFRETAPYGADHWVLEPRIACRPCDFNFVCDHHTCKKLLESGQVALLVEALLWEPAMLPAVLAQLSSFDVYRTTFDGDGLLDYERLTPRPLDQNDVLLHVFRVVILQSELGGSFPQRLAAGLACLRRDGLGIPAPLLPTLQESLDRFDQLERLASRGVHSLEQASDALYARQLEQLNHWIMQADGLDREILLLSRQHGDVRLLARTFVLHKEAVKSDAPELLLRGDLACYEALRQVVRWSQEALLHFMTALGESAAPASPPGGGLDHAGVGSGVAGRG